MSQYKGADFTGERTQQLLRTWYQHLWLKKINDVTNVWRKKKKRVWFGPTHFHLWHPPPRTGMKDTFFFRGDIGKTHEKSYSLSLLDIRTRWLRFFIPACSRSFLQRHTRMRTPKKLKNECHGDTPDSSNCKKTTTPPFWTVLRFWLRCRRFLGGQVPNSKIVNKSN